MTGPAAGLASDASDASAISGYLPHACARIEVDEETRDASDASDATLRRSNIPADWSTGFSRLLATSSPSSVDPFRWARFRVDAEGVLLHHGAELIAAGWDALDVFGLHSTAPEHRPDAAGLAWLLRGRGVGQITPETVEITTPAGAVLRTCRMGQQARREAVLAWELR